MTGIPAGYIPHNCVPSKRHCPTSPGMLFVEIESLEFMITSTRDLLLRRDDPMVFHRRLGKTCSHHRDCAEGVEKAKINAKIRRIGRDEDKNMATLLEKWECADLHFQILVEETKLANVPVDPKLPGFHSFS